MSRRERQKSMKRFVRPRYLVEPHHVEEALRIQEPEHRIQNIFYSDN
jgi:hypothetical protein